MIPASLIGRFLGLYVWRAYLFHGPGTVIVRDNPRFVATVVVAADAPADVLTVSFIVGADTPTTVVAVTADDGRTARTRGLLSADC